MPRLHESSLLKLDTVHGILAQFVALVMVAAANKFNRAASVRLVPVDPKDFTHEANPSPTTELGERFEFLCFVDVVPVDTLAGDIAPTANHAADTLLELIESGDILSPVAANLACRLARDG
jgi:hypothetical protein